MSTFLAIIRSFHLTDYWIIFFTVLIEVIISIGLFSPTLKWMLFLGALGASILAGVGILNIWLVTLILCLGVLLGDSVNYFLGRKYGVALYQYLEKKVFLRKYINETNYSHNLKFFQEYGKHSIFFAKFLKTIFWAIPFLAGSHKLNYKTFLIYDLPAIILSLGRFIVAGYFLGIYFEVISILFLKYLFIILFLILILFYLYFYLKYKKYIAKFKQRWRENRKKLFILTIKHFISITIVIIIFFAFFLFYLSFKYNGSAYYVANSMGRSIVLNDDYLNDCKNITTYYFDSQLNIIQPINVILISNKGKDISNILNKNWVQIPIFRKNQFTFNDFLSSIEKRKLPASNLYLDNFSQDVAYQYKKSSLIRREHIRFWKFINKNNPNQNIYFGSISNDDGLTFQFYDNFLTPLHGISRNTDKSRDFFYKHIIFQKNITCHYIQTTCRIKKVRKNSDEQQYYTDGKILVCKIK